MSLTPLPLSFAVLAVTTFVNHTAGPAGALEMGSMVQAYCLAAVEQEMTQAGRVPPQGMADYACRCVVNQLTKGTSLHSARTYCRESTARRYAL
ncbi:MAG: hypothetical protein ACKOYH_07770 [Cyanobium sp.]